MWKKNTDIQLIETPCITNLPYVFLVRHTDPGNTNIRVVMTSVSDDELEKLSWRSVNVNRGDLMFMIDNTCVFAMGEFDFHPNSDDILKMDAANWFNRLYVNQIVYSDYDYETHSIKSETRNLKWYDTARLKTYLPYLYGCLGKPKNVVIFREYINLSTAARNRRQAAYYREHVEYEKKQHTIRNREKAKIKRSNKLNKLKLSINK